MKINIKAPQRNNCALRVITSIMNHNFIYKEQTINSNHANNLPTMENSTPQPCVHG